MRYAIIQEGVVANIAVADGPLGGNWIPADGCDIGDLWDGEKFTKPGISQEEIDEAWVRLRKRRDGLLSISDWTQLPDNSLTAAQRSEAATYRQALRDFPAGCQDALNPVWPEAPSFLG